MADIQKTLPRQARAIAAWESAVVRTLNPHLNDKQADAVWAVVVKNREAPNADTFSKSINDLLDGAPTPIRSAATAMVENLRSILKTVKD